GPHAVCLPGGRYDLRSIIANNASFDLSSVDLGASCATTADCAPVGGTCVANRCRAPATDLEFIGSGSSTVLMLNAPLAGTWNMFYGASEVTFRDLVLDGSGAASSSASSLVQLGVGGTASHHINFDHVTLRSAKTAAIASTGTVTAVSVVSSR